MAIRSLAVVGKNNEPLYLREFGATSSDPFFEDDLFGLSISSSTDRKSEQECSLRQQFILHAALDRFEQIEGPPPGFGWRTPGAKGADVMWAGLLLPVEEMRVYGYMTTTRIKLLVVVDDDVVPEHGDQQNAKDLTIKSFLINTHRLFVEYTLNPFNGTGESKIVSKRFDDDILDLAMAFNKEATY